MKDILVSLTLLGTLTAGLAATHYHSQKPTKAPSSKPVLASFKANGAGHNWVELKWQEPNSDQIEHIHIFREQHLIARISPGKKTFTDRLLLDNKVYEYGAEIHYKDDSHSRRITLQTKTKANNPPKLSWHPSIIKLSNQVQFGDEITILKAIDEESDELYFSLEGEDARHFLINSSTGKIIYGETQTEKLNYFIRIKVSDGNKNDHSVIHVTLAEN